jgi:hypothetical protein
MSHPSFSGPSWYRSNPSLASISSQILMSSNRWSTLEGSAFRFWLGNVLFLDLLALVDPSRPRPRNDPRPAVDMLIEFGKDAFVRESRKLKKKSVVSRKVSGGARQKRKAKIHWSRGLFLPSFCPKCRWLSALLWHPLDWWRALHSQHNSSDSK